MRWSNSSGGDPRSRLRKSSVGNARQWLTIVQTRGDEVTATRFESMKATNDNGIDWMARARAYAAKVERAVQGSKGSGQLMAMIRLVYNRFPLSPEQLRQIVQEYSDDCLPPWNDAEIDHAIASIRKIPSKELWLTEGNTSRKPNKPKPTSPVSTPLPVCLPATMR